MGDPVDSVAPATSVRTAFIARAAAITSQLDHESKAKRRFFLELTGPEFCLHAVKEPPNTFYGIFPQEIAAAKRLPRIPTYIEPWRSLPDDIDGKTDKAAQQMCEDMTLLKEITECEHNAGSVLKAMELAWSLPIDSLLRILFESQEALHFIERGAAFDHCMEAWFQ